jgi:hypothetical protein
MTMSPLQRSAALLCAVLALALAAAPLSAQTVEGSLVQSSDGAPVSGALVILMDQAAQELARTRTGGQGGFRFEDLAAGLYMVVVEQEGYANHLTEPFAVADDETYELNLTVSPQRVGDTGVAADTLSDAELLASAVADACRSEFIPSMHGILFGAIRDSESGQPIPGASARLRWRQVDTPGVPQSEVTVHSDEIGAYLVCTVPAGRDVEVRANLNEVEGPRETVQVRAGRMRRQDFVIPLSDPTLPGNILGRVLDNRTGAPLAGASIRLQGTGRSAVTNTRGIFVLRDLPAGADTLRVELVGYADKVDPIQVVGGRAQDVQVRMATQPIELSPMLVTVQPRRWFSDRADVENRIERGNGIILTRADIEQRQPVLLGDALRGLPGVRVERSGGGVTAEYAVQLRGAATLTSAACRPMVWVDGRRWGADGSAFREIQGADLDVIEIYRGPAEVPGEFSGGDARCGVVAVWTRRGF